MARSSSCWPSFSPTNPPVCACTSAFCGSSHLPVAWLKIGVPPFVNCALAEEKGAEFTNLFTPAVRFMLKIPRLPSIACTSGIPAALCTVLCCCADEGIPVVLSCVCFDSSAFTTPDFSGFMVKSSCIFWRLLFAGLKALAMDCFLGVCPLNPVSDDRFATIAAPSLHYND